MLYDLFSNLISNAVKYDENPKKVIDIILIKNDSGDVSATSVQVIDRACGIPDDEKEKIFERYNRLKRSKSGSGLGLSIAREIVEKYDGTIWVDNRVPEDYQKGSVFNVVLPDKNEPQDCQAS